MIREDLGGRFLWILPLSILAALLLSYLVFQNIGDVLLTMTPVLAAFCGLFILGALTGFKATPAAAFALILLTGLAIDYGIYAVSQLRHPEEISVRSSVVLSAATTVAGAGALIFSRHPVLFGTGIVLSIGITLACLSGLYLVPMLKKIPAVRGLPLFLLIVLTLSGCTAGIPFSQYPEADSLRRKITLYPEACFQIQANAVMEIQGNTFSFILAVECNPADGEIKISGISGTGILLFRMDRDSCKPGSGLPLQLKKPLNALRKDFQRIFLLKEGNPLAVTRKTEYISLSSDDGVKWEIYPDKLVRKKGCYPFRKWECIYSDSGRTLFYRNRDWNYTIKLTITKLVKKER